MPSVLESIPSFEVWEQHGPPFGVPAGLPASDPDGPQDPITYDVVMRDSEGDVVQFFNGVSPSNRRQPNARVWAARRGDPVFVSRRGDEIRFGIIEPPYDGTDCNAPP